MANCLPFSKNKSIVCEDGTVTWTNQLVSQSPLSFSNTEDSLNETYATAVDVNETQYLSVLESGDDTLQEIDNLTLSHQKLIVNDDDIALNIEHDNNFDSADSEQVVIFNIEGSDELYGIQVAHDEDGNVHRYQFQFRKTDDGQLEAMPETIQLLTNDEDPTLTTEEHTEIIEFGEDQVTEETFEHPVLLQETLEQTDEDSQNLLIQPEQAREIFEKHANLESDAYNDSEDMSNPIIYLKNENICNEMTYEDEEELCEDFETDYTEEIIDIKPGTEIIKQELIHNRNQAYVHDSQESGEETVLNEEYASEDETPIEGEETIISYQHFEPHEEHYENSNESQIDNVATHFLVEDGNLDPLNYNIELHHEEEEEECNENSRNVLIVEKSPNDSENEDFEIVEGLPVTAEGEMSEDTSSSIYQETEVVYNEPEIIYSPKEKSPKSSNILKQPTNMNKINSSNKKTILYYMVPSTDQKENLNSITLNSTNPRSVLKNNVELHKMNDEHAKTLQREKLMEKRYARSKEVIQAKMFNNFINKTTIPHAPIRQGRMPRKQEIVPVDTRTNEEIIVQEVMVSSKGFVENLNERLKSLDKLEITSIVELSDSDEDYDPKNSTKKKKKHKKIKPTNTETSDSDTTSIIEIYSDDEPTENSIKRTRGRPKKGSEESLKRTRGKGSKSGSSDESSPQKKSRTEESSELESDSGKKEINCPHCSKTFPNQNSLSTHIQHHNLENSLRNCKKIPTIEYKHKCEDCELTFKNTILLKRHICSNKNPKPTYKCTACPKIFRDVAVFNIHKKSHAKENLIKSTTSIIISPKKFTPNQRLVTYKCKECSKVCSSQTILSVHEKTHKKFTCTSCKASFNSKLLLDMHVRIKCVKTSSPKDNNKRLSFKIKKSFVSSPRRASIRGTRSVNPNVQNRRSAIPTTTNRNTSNVAKKSQDVNFKPNTAFNKQRKSVYAFSNTKKENIKANSTVLETGTSVINPVLNNTGTVRTLDVEARCDSCSMSFSSLTALFKHKVKTHGLSTPDKRVLEQKKKSLHKPLHLHGGIPANQSLNKAFQAMRRKLMSENTDFPEETNPPVDNSVKIQSTGKDELPTIIVSESTEPEQSV